MTFFSQSRIDILLIEKFNFLMLLYFCWILNLIFNGKKNIFIDQ